MSHIIKTERLLLRQWREEDKAPFAEMNKDPEVMQYFPNALSREDSDGLVDRLVGHRLDHGFTYWAVDEIETGKFVGFVGLKWQTYESPFTPCVDIGWRLSRSSWGKGYATEGAIASLDYGFEVLNLKEIYSFCPEINVPSEKVMKKIGMQRVGEFLHPLLENNSPLQKCVTYRIEKP